MAPVRGGPLVGDTVNPTEALPLPFADDVREIHEASVEAVQVHIWLDAMTSTVPDPPDCGKPADGSRKRIRHVPAACVISALLSFNVTVARRVTGSALAPAEYSIEPSPCPLFGPTMLSQLASDTAVQTHSRAVVTTIRPVPPSGGTVELEVASATPQREIGDGAVEVDVDEPHAETRTSSALPAPARPTRKRSENRMTSMMAYGRGWPHGEDEVYQEGCREAGFMVPKFTGRRRAIGSDCLPHDMISGDRWSCGQY